jgi:hypothetical protein
MNNKHSPAPWVAVDRPGAGWAIKANLRSWDRRLLEFAEAPVKPEICLNLAEGWEEELAANMQLMAAAPDMLKMLEEVYEILDKECPISYTDVIERIGQTIAKAKK